MKLSNMLVALAVMAAVVGTAAAAADLQITELYAGLTGEDGTEDWLELTNYGDTAADMGGDANDLFGSAGWNFYYDDESADPTKNTALRGILSIAPGESVIYLIDSTVSGAPGNIDDMQTIWGGGYQVGIIANAGGLGQGGDAAYVFDGNLEDSNTVDSASYDSIGDLATLDVAPDGTTADSVVGVNGAYVSNAFFNDNIGEAPDYDWTLIGSPGVVPEPATMSLLALAGVAVLRRRR
jgi:hypothetical protein